MDLWFRETHQGKVGFSLKVIKTLFHGNSPYQKLDIIDTEGMGRVMLLDGLIMVTERDEFIYHEMITHVPLNSHPAPKNVLVIGGGDGGTVREIVKHPDVVSVDLVEIDQLVVDKAREFFPTISCELDNPKVNVLYEDGIKFIKTKKDHYDVIIIDSTDPIGPAVGLFSKEFHTDCFAALKKDGILTAQSEDPFFDGEILGSIYNSLRQLFPCTRIFLAAIPSYPGSLWSFAFASKKYKPLMDLNQERADKISKTTKYYNTNVHTASFALPNFVKKALE